MGFRVDMFGCSLVQDAVPEEDTQQELMETIQKGNFTMRILYEQLGNILKMGPMGQMMSMIPGFSNSGLFTKVWPCQSGSCFTVCSEPWTPPAPCQDCMMG